MPLIILTGYPSTGKTTTALKLKEHFSNDGIEVHLVSEEDSIIKAGFDKNNVYEDSSKEKHIRCLLKSEATKVLTPRNLVILDGLNYIKGYRYELYCATKSNSSTQCTIETIINKDEAWQFNENRTNKYSRSVFDALIMRYEEPDSKNRWDSPLHRVYSDGNIDMEAITDCLFKKKAPPKNMSTQNAPLNSTNFLYDLNKITKDISTEVIKLINVGTKGEIEVPGYEHLTLNITGVTIQKIIILTKQYITYSKMHAPDIKEVPQLYVQFLKANIG